MGPVSSWRNQHQRGEAAALPGAGHSVPPGLCNPDTLLGGGLGSHTAPSTIPTTAVPPGSLFPGVVPHRSTAQPLLRQGRRSPCPNLRQGQ